MSEVARIGSVISFHLSKLWKAKFSILCDVIFLVRQQGKFDIDHLGLKGVKECILNLRAARLAFLVTIRARRRRLPTKGDKQDLSTNTDRDKCSNHDKERDQFISQYEDEKKKRQTKTMGRNCTASLLNQTQTHITLTPGEMSETGSNAALRRGLFSSCLQPSLERSGGTLAKRTRHQAPMQRSVQMTSHRSEKLLSLLATFQCLFC